MRVGLLPVGAEVRPSHQVGFGDPERAGQRRDVRAAVKGTLARFDHRYERRGQARQSC